MLVGGTATSLSLSLLPRSELLEGLFGVLASAGDGGAEVGAGAGHQTRNNGGAGPGGRDGTICAEKSLCRAAGGDAENRGRRHGESVVLERVVVERRVGGRVGGQLG